MAIFIRFVDYFRWLPKRAWRIFLHLLYGIYQIRPRPLHWWESGLNVDLIQRISLWWLELIIYLLECLGVGELYETITDLVKWNTRGLHDWEIELARTVYGDCINYRRIRVDEMAFAGPKQYRFCYVSFYMINSWGTMQNSTFLHELIHIWQYEKLGAVYMPRALMAQRSKMGYNYGGVTSLQACLNRGENLLAFNLEQQGDIIADYYLIKEGYRPRWGRGQRKDLPIYATFIRDLKA